MLTWQRYDGKRLKLEEIPNDHLANIIHHIKAYSRYYTLNVMDIMMNEAQKRHLSEEFLSKTYSYDGQEQCQKEIELAGMQRTRL